MILFSTPTYSVPASTESMEKIYVRKDNYKDIEKVLDIVNTDRIYIEGPHEVLMHCIRERKIYITSVFDVCYCVSRVPCIGDDVIEVSFEDEGDCFEVFSVMRRRSYGNR